MFLPAVHAKKIAHATQAPNVDSEILRTLPSASPTDGFSDRWLRFSSSGPSATMHLVRHRITGSTASLKPVRT